MQNYNIEFDFLGKKYKTQISAASMDDAKKEFHKAILSKIQITNIENKTDKFDISDIFTFLK